MLQVCAPDFIVAAILQAIDAAARSKGLPIPMCSEDEDETREQALKKLADIFTIARDYKAPDADSAAALAAHLSAVSSHPLLPAEAREALTEVLATLDDYVDRSSPEYLEGALVAANAAEGREVRAQ